MKVRMICLALSLVALTGLSVNAFGQTKQIAKKKTPLATPSLAQRPLGQSQRPTASSRLPTSGRRPVGQLRAGGRQAIPSAGSRPPSTGGINNTPQLKPYFYDVQAPRASTQSQPHQAVSGGFKKE